MTIAEHSLPEALPSLGRRRWLVRWSSSVTAWMDPLGACRDGQRHGSIQMVVAVELIEPSRAIVEAWLELPGRRKTVLGRQTAACASFQDDGLLHVDVRLSDRRAVAMSVDASGERLLFAQSDLFGAAGFGVGALDPPTVEVASVGQDAASA